MKVLRLHGIRDLRLHDEPQPQPAPGEALVRVTAVGVCGSDLHWFAEQSIGDSRLDHPLVLGHEFAGVIAEGPRRGQRVAIDPSMPCGHCEFCLEGNPNLCPDVRFAGHGSQDGAMRQYLVWPERLLHPLPDSVSDAEGAMLEPLGIALHSVNLAHLRPGMQVGVYGCGPIGLLILQVARLSGAVQIFATDKLAHRLEAARSLGAEIFQADDDSNEIVEIMAATGGRGVDVAFEAAGENAAVRTSVATTKPGGCVILAGIPSEDDTIFSSSVARRKGLTFKLVRRMKHTYPPAIRLVESGLVDVKSLVTHCYPLTESIQAFEIALKREGLKVMIEP